MIQSSTMNRTLRGLSFHNSPPLAYQQFVDDNILFGHSSIQEAPTNLSILQTFEEASRTTLNLEKSQIFFFNNQDADKRNITRILRFSISSLPSKYLGTPLFTFPLSTTLRERF